MKTLPITEADLHAYADQRLPDSRRAEVDAYLAQHPKEAERVRIYRQQNQAIQALFNPILDEPAPQRIRHAAHPPVPKASTQWLPRWSLERVAASVALAFVGAASGWIGRGMLQPAPAPTLAQSALPAPTLALASLPRQAAMAHIVYSPDVRRPVEIGADQEDQLVAWLSKRLKSPIHPPKLQALGYELIGGRLLPGANGPVAQFMYHDMTGQRLTLYVSNENTANQDTGFRFAQEGPVNVFYWIDGKFGYALSSGIDRAELTRVASAVHTQLQPP